MRKSKNTVSAPGLAFKTLLRQTKPRALRDLIGSSTVNLLKGLDTDITNSNELGEFVANLINPVEALKDSATRTRIINLLPLPKACELAKKLGVEDGRDIFTNLHKVTEDKVKLSELFSFFGIVQEVRAPFSKPSNKSLLSPKYRLFHHQRTTASKALDMLSKTPRKVVLHMPTGAGKTRTAMHIISEHLRTKEPGLVCWLAQNAELLDQAANEFENAWSYLGNREVNILRFWGSRDTDPMSVNDGVIIAGLGKMYEFDKRHPADMLRLADRTSLIVIDEAHQAIAPTYSSILSALYTKRPSNALLGLTATPGRTWSNITEDQKLSDFFDGNKVMLEVEGYEDPITFLIAEDYLAEPTFRTLNSQAGLQLSKKDISDLSASVDIPQALLQRLGEDTQRNLRIITGIEDLTKRHNRIMFFAPSVDNARLISALLVSRGYVSYVVTGITETTERERIVRRFRSNSSQPMILCNYGVLTTGFDAPSVSAAMIARPTMSLVLYSQMVGRATRGPKAGGNSTAEIITVIDPRLPGFSSIADAFKNWEDVWNDRRKTDL